MVCSWCHSYIAPAALESFQLQKYFESPRVSNREAVSGARNGSFHYDSDDNDNHSATGTQTVERPLFCFSSCCLLQRVNRSLMRSFGVARSEILKQRPYRNYWNSHNLTSRSCRSVLDIGTTRESTKTVNHLNRYHHQFPLDLQGWPRRWTQTVLYNHISVVI
jgi:hypothetical protein